MKYLFAFGAATDQGDWPVQEDAYWLDPMKGVFVLADAFGGADSGDRAAALAVSTVGEWMSKEDGLDAEQSAKRQAQFPFFSPEEYYMYMGLDSVNKKILDLNKDAASEAKAGVSLTVARFYESGRIIVGSVGACGSAVLRSGQAISLLPPDALSAQSGELIGARSDTFGEDFPLQFLGLVEAVDPDVRTFHFPRGDKLLLFTEGFCRGNKTILEQAALLAQDPIEPNLERKARELLEVARSSLGRIRNASVVLVDCRGGISTSP